MKNLNLSKPIVFLDLETTGLDVEKDRIIDISAIKYDINKQSSSFNKRLNPGILIPPEASNVHKIFNKDVQNKPSFSNISSELIEFIGEDSILCGYNLKRFDFRMLQNEFKRIGKEDFPSEATLLLDPLDILKTYEKQTLSFAMKFYLNKSHENAHSAQDDVLATIEVLDAMIERYDLPKNDTDLVEKFSSRSTLDSRGCFAKVDGKIVFNFGKHKDKSINEIAKEYPGYLNWMLGDTFPDDTKKIIQEALK